MTAFAHLHPDATLSPTKDELCAEYSAITERLGSYRAVDPEGEVGIEVIVGRTFTGELAQLSLTYRAADNAVKKELCRMQHSVLGERSVAFGADDRVARDEWTRIVVESDTSAEFSTGPQRFRAYGTGGEGQIFIFSTLVEEDPAPGQLRVIDAETGKDYLAGIVSTRAKRL
ncbi:hypothetical protein G7Y31_00455 [Corynebacterium lizhenjunii]|uniref:Maltokinase N-terminal cap domain-containing protein n=1 Tax=Corynebacterium lizhenjunii TaxID=2709394 RepID=A0A7T0PC22_9CORY|nr:hypothetical protein [Corynebacterium lizhenjunii]QPK79247.1 hypothetical protein G7Y31_00455 [Corynebacterium lizhenjunii]